MRCDVQSLSLLRDDAGGSVARCASNRANFRQGVEVYTYIYIHTMYTPAGFVRLSYRLADSTEELYLECLSNLIHLRCVAPSVPVIDSDRITTTSMNPSLN